MSANSSPVPPIPDDLKPDSVDGAQEDDAAQDEVVADEATREAVIEKENEAINGPQAPPIIEGELEG